MTKEQLYNLIKDVIDTYENSLTIDVKEVLTERIYKIFLEKTLLGRNKDYVNLYCQAQNLLYRIVKEDRNVYVVTHDFKPERLNFTFTNNQLTSITYG